jgi:hypothetical protein
MFEGNQFKRWRAARPELPVVHTTFYVSLHLNL